MCLIQNRKPKKHPTELEHGKPEGMATKLGEQNGARPSCSTHVRAKAKNDLNYSLTVIIERLYPKGMM